MEIGSIFEADIEGFFKPRQKEFHLPFMDNKNFNYHLFFNTGRSAIEYLLKQYSSQDKNKILLPAFNCSSVIDAVKRANIDYDFYSITDDLQINIDSVKEKLDGGVKFVYIIQYFGGYQNQVSYEFLKELQSENIVIVEDISHALYTKHDKFIGFGDYVLGSLRKWLPIPDGAFLSSSHEIPLIAVENSYNEYSFNYFAAQVMKSVYIQEDLLDKERFLELNAKAMESLFSDYTIREMTDLSLNYLLSYNMEEVIEKRLENYKYLFNKIDRFPSMVPISLNNKGQVPFGLVVLTEYRNELLKHLIDNNIYCNIHWKLTNECIDADDVSRKISERVLTIPCDQRYGEKEMSYIISILDEFEVIIKSKRSASNNVNR